MRTEPVFMAAPQSEFDRRRTAIQAQLKDMDADALIAMSTADNLLNCYVRWLTGSSVNYCGVIIVYADAPATMIEHGAIGGGGAFTGGGAGGGGGGGGRAT